MDTQTQHLIITTLLLIANGVLFVLQRSNKNTLVGKIADLEQQVSDCLEKAQSKPEQEG